MGELLYACKAEMAYTLADLLIRRTRLAFELPDHGQLVAQAVARFVAPTLGWSDADAAAEVGRYLSEVDRMFRVDLT